MKKLTILLAGIFAVLSISAQIPNNDFENWGNGPNNPPDGWWIWASDTSAGHPVTRSTDHVSGNYSVQIQTIINGADTSRGQLTTGTQLPDTSQGAPMPTFPVSQRHTSFKGYYKYAPQNGDSADLICLLFKTGFVSPGSISGSLGGAELRDGAAVPVFTPFSVNFSYYDTTGLTPDSGWIILGAFAVYHANNPNAGASPQGQSVLHVDALSFDTYIAGIQQVNDITENFKLMPTVNDGMFHVQYQLKESGYTTLKIYDLNGKEIRSLSSGNCDTGYYTADYNVSGLANGTYLLMLGSETGFHSELMIIQK